VREEGSEMSNGGLCASPGDEADGELEWFEAGGDSGHGSSTSGGGGAGGDLGEEERGEMTGEWRKGDGGMWIVDGGEGPDDEEEEPGLLACCSTWRRAAIRGDLGEGFDGGERDLRCECETTEDLEERAGE
jgi:hypothetical protein